MVIGNVSYEKNHKIIFLIISIYLIHLLIYIGMVHIINTNITNWTNIVNKLKINSNIDSYTYVYIHIYYFGLSTYFMLKSLKIPIGKMLKIIIFIITFAFIFMGLYKHFEIIEKAKALTALNFFYNLYNNH